MDRTFTVDRPDLVSVRERHSQLLERIAERYEQLDERLTELEGRLPFADEQPERLVRKPR